MKRPASLAALLFLSTFAAACLDDSITGSRTLEVELTTSEATVEAGETLTSTVTAMGTGLQGLLIDWGDGVVDSLTLSGLVVTAESAFDHDYSAAGSYVIVASAEDQSGTVTDSAAVEVTDAPDR